jgi:hypothetical protein
MTVPTMPTRGKPEGKLAFHVERGPQSLTVAIRGEGSFEQAEVTSAQLLRILSDGYFLAAVTATAGSSPRESTTIWRFGR